jgi:Protein of unknown function (DUF4446)
VEEGVGQLNDILSSNLAVVVVVLVAACVVLAVLVAVLMRNINAQRDRLDALTRGADGKDLESVLNEHLESVFRVAAEIGKANGRIQVLEESAFGHFSRLGLIRFNPFSDTGGNQSYALALLDGRGNGFVVSSLHSRAGTRMYAKGVSGGKADTALSEEETQAIETALGRKKKPVANVRVAAAPPTPPVAPAPPAAPSDPSDVVSSPPIADAPSSWRVRCHCRRRV